MSNCRVSVGRMGALSFVALAAFVLPTLAAGADLTGDWVATAPRPGRDDLRLMLRLKQQGAILTGIASFPWADLAIINGKVSGDRLSFAVQIESDEKGRTIYYTGTATNDRLELTSLPAGNIPSNHFVGRRATPEEAAANWPQKTPPPALHNVPSNGLARTPPMGWNSWNHFKRDVNDKVIRETADAMASNGMKAAGYVYVNIDDTWEGTRDAQGNIRSNEKFPDMKALADYVHSKGLKLGIYSSPGPKTCAGYEGSFGHEGQDAKTFAAWGIDYLKYDWCSAGRLYVDSDMQALYQKMGDALFATHRPIVYSLCEYGREQVWEWGPAVDGNLWRTTGDISDNWKSMIHIALEQDGLEKFAAPGHWNDPDMLEIGNGGMSETEYKTHMTLWAMFAAPLLAGNDLRSANQPTLDILENPEVVAIDQDPAGHQGRRLFQGESGAAWVRTLSDGSQAVALVNPSDSRVSVSVQWKDLGWSGAHQVRDLWAHADRGAVAESFSADIPSHGAALIKVKP